MRLLTRRRANLAIAAGGISILIPRRTQAAAIEMRQVHNQPVDSPLHRRLTQMWDGVAGETGGRVQARVLAGRREAEGNYKPMPPLNFRTHGFPTLARPG